MSEIEIIRTEAFKVNAIAIRQGDETWLTFGARWWELGRWLWWWLTPGRKAWVLVDSKGQGERIRVRATRVAQRTVNAGERLP